MSKNINVVSNFVKTLLYFFSCTIYVGVQQELSDTTQCLYQRTIRFELNQKSCSVEV